MYQRDGIMDVVILDMPLVVMNDKCCYQVKVLEFIQTYADFPEI